MTKSDIKKFEIKLKALLEPLDKDLVYALSLGRNELKLLDEIEGNWEFSNVIIVPHLSESSIFELECRPIIQKL